MKRANIQLRSLARAGDLEARMKLGIIYLEGSFDFPKNIKLALEYLSVPALEISKKTAVAICSRLNILEIIENSLIDNLRSAASIDSMSRIKLLTLMIIKNDLKELSFWINKNDSASCRKFNRIISECPSSDMSKALSKISEIYSIETLDVLAVEAKNALISGCYEKSEEVLSLVLPTQNPIPSCIYETIANVAMIAEERGRSLEKLSPLLIESSLEHSAAGNNKNSCYLLGRMLAGLKTKCISTSEFSRPLNLRRATVFLLKAADHGRSEAWLDLFHLHSDYRSSVGNSSMARFCLEKASFFGVAEAKRRLGVLTLKEAKTIENMEEGLSLLYESSITGDVIANGILKTLVLDVHGSEDDAISGIEEVQQLAPLLATRLRLARCFGLTKLEALSVNPTTAIRPWGLVIERNPHIKKGNLAEPRAIPAASRKAIECIRNAAMEFAPKGEISNMLEGSLRTRSLNQRRIFKKINLQESLFFSKANSVQRDSLRIGARWAQNQKIFIDQALA